MTGDRSADDHRPARSLSARGRPIQGSEGAIEQVAASDATVLILGERGVGHEEVARTVHRLSPRRDRPYEEVNCTVPVERLDQELFGDSRRGASGRGTPGKLVLAHTGTIFLDDVGELPPAVQRKLLLVLQERQVTQAGADEPVTVDVRVITATRRDLRPQVERGSFRQDLYYRLNVLRLYVRPLRQRRDEIAELARFYLDKYSRRHGRPARVLSAATLDRLMRHHWPGNLSELENLMERVVVLDSEQVVAQELDGAPEAPRTTDTIPTRTAWSAGCVSTPRTTPGGNRRRMNGVRAGRGPGNPT